MVNNGGQYLLGTGDYVGSHDGMDEPWTLRDGQYGSDCAGFAICFAWKLVRHRPGFNSGPWASVSDDINCDSALEDADHKQELFRPVDFARESAQPGDLVIWPTIQIPASAPPHQVLSFMGHVGLIEAVPATWVPEYMGVGFKALTVLQCHGGNGRTPGVVRTDGSYWATHTATWPRPEHRARVIRVKERT